MRKLFGAVVVLVCVGCGLQPSDDRKTTTVSTSTSTATSECGDSVLTSGVPCRNSVTTTSTTTTTETQSAKDDTVGTGGTPE